MKRWVWVMGFVIFLVALSATPACASDQPYGQFRALKRRVATVMQQKNDFVARVLHSHNIAHQRNAEGVVTQLQIGSRWHDVNLIEIVPSAGGGARPRSCGP